MIFEYMFAIQLRKTVSSFLVSATLYADTINSYGNEGLIRLERRGSHVMELRPGGNDGVEYENATASRLFLHNKP